MNGIAKDHWLLQIRQKIDSEVRFIQNLTGLLAQFEHSGKERIEVDPVTLGVLNSALAQSAGNIRRALDECLPMPPGAQPSP
ncbi:MAG TPA: hypothetical protein VF268_14105 [Gammaproteobacteria bacterium]